MDSRVSDVVCWWSSGLNNHSTRKGFTVLIEFARIASSLIFATVGLTELLAADETASYVVSDQKLLDNPNGLKLSLDGKRLFVADTDNDRIVVLDPNTLEFAGEFGNGHLDGVRDIDIDRRGILYAADTHNNRIAIYDIASVTPRLIGELRGSFSRPEGVLTHPNGNVYVSGLWSRNIVAFRNGKVVAIADSLSAPHALELARDGRIWVSDPSKNQLLILSSQLKLERIINGTIEGFHNPHDIKLLANGSVIIVEKFEHRIRILSLGGKTTQVIGDGLPSDGEGKFRLPSKVESCGMFIWVADSGNNRIVRYTISIN